MTGYRREQLLSMNVAELDPDVAGRWSAVWDDCRLKGSMTFESRHSLADGSALPVEITATFVSHDGQDTIIAFVRDIARRVQAEQKLKEQVDLMQALLNTIPSPIFYKDSDGVYCGCNRAFEELMNLPHDQIVGQTVFDLAEKDQAGIYAEHDRQLLERGGRQNYESKVSTSDGHVWDVLFNKATFQDLHGKIAGLVGVITDITELKQTQRALEESQRNLQNLMAHLEEMVFVLDRRGTILQVNPTCWNRLGYGREDLAQKPLRELVVPDAWAEMDQLLVKLADGEPFGAILPLLRPGQDPLDLRVRLIPGRWTGQDVGLLMGLAVSPNDAERSESSQRLTAPREQLLRGLLGDLHQIFVAILGTIELTRIETPTNSTCTNYLDNVERASVLSCELLRDLRSLAGGDPMHPCPLRLQEMIRDLQGFFKSLLPPQITLHCEIDDGLEPCQADAGMLRQMLVQLIRNAVNAMRGQGGIVAVHVSTLAADRELLNACHAAGPLQPGDYLCIEITDTGKGFEPGALRDALRQNRPTASDGPGFGLARVASLLQAQQGALHVRSTPGAGTTVRLLLPPAVHIAPRTPPTAAEPPPEDHAPRILIVDDQEPVLRVTARMLQRCGWSPLCATDGQQAIEVFQQESVSIHAVLLDLGLPKLSGAEVFNQLRVLRPNIPIVICTGLSEADVLERLNGIEPTAILRKPFQIDALQELLDHCLPASP